MEQADSELRVPGLPPIPLSSADTNGLPQRSACTKRGVSAFEQFTATFHLIITRSWVLENYKHKDVRRCSVKWYLLRFFVFLLSSLIRFLNSSFCSIAHSVNPSDLPICAENLIMNGFFWKIFWNCFDPLWLQVWIVFGLLATILLNGFQLAIGLNKTLKSVMLVNNPENCIWRARLHKKREKKDNLLLPWN